MSTQLIMLSISLVLAGFALGWSLCQTLMIRFFAKESMNEVYELRDKLTKKDEYWCNKYYSVSRRYEPTFDYKIIHSTEYQT